MIFKEKAILEFQVEARNRVPDHILFFEDKDNVGNI